MIDYYHNNMEKSQESVPVDCSFCKTSITCPPDKLDAHTHACHECFLDLIAEGKEIKNIHVDIPRKELARVNSIMMAGSLRDAAFPEVWADYKKNFKKMSTREIAEEMFALGARCMAESMMEKMARKVVGADTDDDDDPDDDFEEEHETWAG